MLLLILLSYLDHTPHFESNHILSHTCHTAVTHIADHFCIIAVTLLSLPVAQMADAPACEL